MVKIYYFFIFQIMIHAIDNSIFFNLLNHQINLFLADDNINIKNNI